MNPVDAHWILGGIKDLALLGAGILFTILVYIIPVERDHENELELVLEEVEELQVKLIETRKLLPFKPQGDKRCGSS